MEDMQTRILEALQPLTGLSLSIARNAGNMKNFQFGRIQPHPSGKGTVGEYALHIQCPWRMIQAGKILTGSCDYYEQHADGADENTGGPTGNLQQRKLFSLLRGYDPKTRSLVNDAGGLVVESIRSDTYGGLEIEFSGSVSLQIFPDGSETEAWRFFRLGTD